MGVLKAFANAPLSVWILTLLRVGLRQEAPVCISTKSCFVLTTRAMCGTWGRGEKLRKLSRFNSKGQWNDDDGHDELDERRSSRTGKVLDTQVLLLACYETRTWI